MSIPYYQLAVLVHDLACEIRVNDVPVLRLPGGHVESSFDVNPYVLPGKNRLSLRVAPALDKPGLTPSSAASVELGVRPSIADASGEVTPAAKLSFASERFNGTGYESSGEGEPEVDFQALVGTTEFELDVPFGPWFWLQAPELEATEDLRAEVLDMYRRMHAMLAARDIGALSQGCASQAADWQLAYGAPDLDTAQRMLGIAATLGDADVIVEPFPPGVLTLELLGDGRLVQLVDDKGYSPLRLRHKSNDQMLGRFNVVLARAQAGGWVIAR